MDIGLRCTRSELRRKSRSIPIRQLEKSAKQGIMMKFEFNQFEIAYTADFLWLVTISRQQLPAFALSSTINRQRLPTTQCAI
jgi:hypothetical protein